MEYTYAHNNNKPGIQSNPPSSLPDPYSSSIIHQPVPQNPNPTSYSAINYNLGHEAPQQQQQQGGLVFSYGSTSSSVYYQDPIVLQNLGAIDPYRVSEWDLGRIDVRRSYSYLEQQSGCFVRFPVQVKQVAAVSLNGAKKLTPANANSNPYIQSLRSVCWKKGQRKSKMQPVRCDVCKLEFNSKFILEQHRLGKRHKKSLDKLKGGNAIAAPASAPLVTSQVSVNPFVGLQEKPEKVNSANGGDAGNKAVKPVENLETKTRKVLEGGAATDKVRICLVCNVVCNSETVFQFHLTGKQHISTVRKHEKLTTASASLVPSEVSVNTFIGPQEKPDKVNLGNEQATVKKAAEPTENLETKRQKVLEGGAAANEVRMCHVCNVICNSETVFRTHLTGKKHMSNMKKQASGAAPAT